MTENFDYDYVVIGSGFGGSVAALRLTEKGYRVGVLEQGKRFGPEDYAKTTWEAHKYLWAPKLRCFGIFAMSVLRDVLIFHGAGVGGGSLVYANTHLEPHDAFYQDPKWADLSEDWRAELAPYYARARRMLGSVESPILCETDYMLAEHAEDLGRGDTFHRVDVGVFFGEPGEKVPDPYFGGEGPERKGCVTCGACMVGCRHDAKNTLDKNYLYLAEKYGAVIHPETRVRDVRPLGAADGSGGYRVETERSTAWIREGRRTFTARGVVFAGGVMGTVPLLMDCKERGSLPRLSDALGTFVRTNSEAILGAASLDRSRDISQGIAITSGVHVDDDTHIEIVRYGPVADSMTYMTNLVVGKSDRLPRWALFFIEIAKHPYLFLQHLWPFKSSRRAAILLVMQHLDNHMRLVKRRRWFAPWKKTVDSDFGDGEPPPTYMPQAHRAALAMADKMGGYAASALIEVFLNTTTTAHILGGAPMGHGPTDGVIDREHKVFGYENLFVCDGSAIPANLGVNPSLTITAMSERAMERVAPKPGAEVREPIVGTVPEPKIPRSPDPRERSK
ncbi:MAG: GMC family oxidoreductase [Myxococcales bacterium]|nr:GMC family oxidoreductase [Myxococcales bacterium]